MEANGADDPLTGVLYGKPIIGILAAGGYPASLEATAEAKFYMQEYGIRPALCKGGGYCIGDSCTQWPPSPNDTLPYESRLNKGLTQRRPTSTELASNITCETVTKAKQQQRQRRQQAGSAATTAMLRSGHAQGSGGTCHTYKGMGSAPSSSRLAACCYQQPRTQMAHTAFMHGRGRGWQPHMRMGLSSRSSKLSSWAKAL